MENPENLLVPQFMWNLALRFRDLVLLILFVSIRYGAIDVKQFKNTPGSRIAEILDGRSPAGRNDSVQGWHNLFKKILLQMSPYLREGYLVTFRKIEQQESVIFEKLSQTVSVPISVSAIYLPPSVRFQML